MLTKIDLCGQALLKIGENAITSFEDDSAAAKLAKSLYDRTIDTIIAGYNWRFATKKCWLRKTVDGVFIIPSEVLRVVACNKDNYEVIGGNINADADELEITAIVRISADQFPSYFAAVAVTKLAMEFTIPLTGNQNTFALLNALYDSEIRTAKFIDSTTTTPTAIDNFSLLNTRF